MSGFYLMHRGWQDADIFGNAEYSERDAWVWLIENAAWRETKARIKGSGVFLERGQMSFAQRFMAEKWGWSKSRVDRFLKRLCAEGMISICSKNGATAGQGSGQGQSVITICNYAQYQDIVQAERGNTETQNGATAGQQRGKEEQRNNKTKNIITGEPVAFEGSVIKLNQPDYDRWQLAHPDIDLRSALQSRDDWLRLEADEGTRRKWFISTSNWLANKQREARKADRPQMPTC